MGPSRDDFPFKSNSFFCDPFKVSRSSSYSSPMKNSPKKPKKSSLRSNESQPKNVSFADSFGLSLLQVKQFDRYDDLSNILSDIAGWDWERELLELSDPSGGSLFSSTTPSFYNPKTLDLDLSPLHPAKFFLGGGSPTKEIFGLVSNPSLSRSRRRYASAGGALMSKCRSDSTLSSSVRSRDSSLSIPTSERCENLFRIPDISFNASCEHLCEQFPVKLESLACETDYSLSGTVLVRNLCFDKRVLVRISGNHWTSFEEIQGEYLNAKCHHTDRFKFKIDLKSISSGRNSRGYSTSYSECSQSFSDRSDSFSDCFSKSSGSFSSSSSDSLSRNSSGISIDVPRSDSETSLRPNFSTLMIPPLVELCVQYVAGANGDLEFWDNNDGQDYKLFKVSL